MIDPTAAATIDLPLFFTRWIPHFCAPVFVFLAGTSVGLMRSRAPRSEIARLLITRGLWLIAVDFVLMATAISFSPRGIPELGGMTWVLMQVLTAIGVGMITLAALQYLGTIATLFVGAGTVLGHNLLDGVWPTTSFPAETGPLWYALHTQVRVDAGPFQLWFFYPLLPWIGVMALGFGTAGVFQFDPERRRRWLITAGLAMTAAFVALRAGHLYGEPGGWSAQAEGSLHTLASFLGTTRYPPSLQFLLMTLGPAAVFVALAERLRGSRSSRYSTRCATGLPC